MCSPGNEAMCAGCPPQQVAASVHACSRQGKTSSLLAFLCILGAMSLNRNGRSVGRNGRSVTLKNRSAVPANFGLMDISKCAIKWFLKCASFGM